MDEEIREIAKEEAEKLIQPVVFPDVQKVEVTNELQPVVNVTVPEVKVPKIVVPEVKVPTPQVTVHVPEVVIPENTLSNEILEKIRGLIEATPEHSNDDLIEAIKDLGKKVSKGSKANYVGSGGSPVGISDQTGLTINPATKENQQVNAISTTEFNSRDAATLAAGATFQGVGEDVSKYGRVGVAITSDNATDGVLTMEVSHDNVNWGGPTRTWADTRFSQPHMWNIVEKYFRIKYVNGSTEATNLSIQVQYSTNTDIFLGHQLNETLIDETEAIVVRSVAVGQDPNNVYTNEETPGVDDNNSSIVNLTTATSLVFTGEWSVVSGYAGISILVDGTASGTVAGTLQMQFSHDGVTVHRSINVINTDIANVPPRTLGVVAKYFRIIYTAASDLLSFDAQTMFHTQQVSLVSRLDQTLQGIEDVENVRAAVVGQNPDGTYINVGVTNQKAMKVSPPQEGKTAFGEALTVHPTPVMSMAFHTFINPVTIASRANQSGAVTNANNMAVCTTGAASDSSAAVLSKDTVRYHPGEGVKARFTALFTTGVANSCQLAGLGDEGNGLFFGYNGASFGVLHRTGGLREMRILTIDTKSTTAEDITITLDGDAASDVTVTDATATDATTTANEIAAHDYSDVGRGWDAVAVGDTVVFTSWNDEPRTDTYSLSSATTAVGTFAQTIAGVSPTDTWVPQASWNGEDIFDGNGLTGVTIDPTKGNVYQIGYQWLGFGALHFFVEDPTDGEFHLVHTIAHANSNTTPSLAKPTLGLRLSAENFSNTSSLVVKSASMAAFVEGDDEYQGTRLGTKASKTLTGTDVETPIITLRCKEAFQGSHNHGKLKVSLVGGSAEHTKPVILNFYANAVLTGASFGDVNTGASQAEVDTAATAFTGGIFLMSLPLNKVGSDIIDLKDDKYAGLLLPGNSFTATIAPTSGNGAEGVVTFNFVDLF